MSEHKPSIPEFYRGRKLLITGGSGFMGRVLIEKLLRSCPELHTVYLLLRPKKNVQPSMRIKQLIDVPLFDMIRHENPSALDKLVAVCGDVTELGLGLIEEDRRMLQDQVSVIFHAAASVRFDDPIADAILINVRGTREVVNLALGMKNLEVLLHLSTAYCNFDKPEVLEQLYPAPGDWRTMITMAENTNNIQLLNAIGPKIIGTLPNSYTYAKALGEHLINDHRDRLPCVIVRPSIVTSSVDDPMPGWIDNFNGPFGLIVGTSKGLIKTVLGDPLCRCDYVPVDIAIQSMIFIAMHRALSRSSSKLPIYNCSSMTNPIISSDMTDLGLRFLNDYPLEGPMWYPMASVTTCRANYFLRVLLLHMLPAVIIDGMRSLTGHKPFLVRLQRRIYVANMTLELFAKRKTNFVNDKFLAVAAEMGASDLKEFNYTRPFPEIAEYFKTTVLGLRTYALKEPPSSIPQAKVHVNRLYWLHQITKTTFYISLIWAFGVCSRVRAALLFVQNMSDLQTIAY